MKLPPLFELADPCAIGSTHADRIFDFWQTSGWSPADLTLAMRECFENDVLAISWITGALDPEEINLVRRMLAESFSEQWTRRRAAQGGPMSGRSFKIGDEPSPHVLRPFDRREVLSIAGAAKLLGYSPATVRRLVARYDLGRRIGGGNWKVSRVALRMFVEGDAAALAAYHDGRREDPAVRRYFEAVGIAA